MLINDGEKSAAELEREKVQVTTAEPKDEEKKDDKKEEEKKEGEDDVEEEEVSEEEDTEEETDGEEQEEEEKKEDDPEKLKKTIERLQKRVNKKTGNERELKKQLAEAQQALAKKVAEGEVVLTEEDVEKRAVTKAQQIAAETEFNKTCNRLAEEAAKIDKTFDDKIKDLAEEIAPIPGPMIGMLGDLDNGGAVLNYFTDHPEEYEEIIGMSLAKQALKIAKLSEKLVPKKEKKEISKVPAPNRPIKPSNNTDTPLSDKDDMDEWVRKRNAQIAKKRANGGR